jgi:hypothetical protein
MDAARRWQIASLATAVTSLGLGGLLLSRPSVEPVAPIVLDATVEQDLTLVPTETEVGIVPDGPLPSIAGIDVVTPQTPISLTSLASPDSGRSSTPTPTPTPSSTSRTATPVPTATPAPSPTTSPTPAAPTVSTDSPTSSDSVDSLDSP